MKVLVTTNLNFEAAHMLNSKNKQKKLMNNGLVSVKICTDIIINYLLQ